MCVCLKDIYVQSLADGLGSYLWTRKETPTTDIIITSTADLKFEIILHFNPVILSFVLTADKMSESLL